jgi:uncharacterized coiled-coil DUF342 family protein
MQKILQTRQKAEKIQELKNERDMIMEKLWQGKRESEI